MLLDEGRRKEVSGATDLQQKEGGALSVSLQKARWQHIPSLPRLVSQLVLQSEHNMKLWHILPVFINAVLNLQIHHPACIQKCCTLTHSFPWSLWRTPGGRGGVMLWGCGHMCVHDIVPLRERSDWMWVLEPVAYLWILLNLDIVSPEGKTYHKAWVQRCPHLSPQLTHAVDKKNSWTLLLKTVVLIYRLQSKILKSHLERTKRKRWISC